MQLKFSQAVSEVGLLHDIRLSANKSKLELYGAHTPCAATLSCMLLESCLAMFCLYNINMFVLPAYI